MTTYSTPGETLKASCHRPRCGSNAKIRSSRRFTVLVIAAGTLLAAVAVSPRLAAAASRRVLVLPFEGPSASEVQEVISQSLGSEVVTIPTEQADRAAQLLAARTENAPDAYAALCRRLKAVAVVEGKVVKDDRWRLRLSVRQGGNGSVAGAVTWSGVRFKEMTANVQRGAPYWMQSMLDAAENGQTASPAPARPPVSAAAAAPSRSAVVQAEADDPPSSRSAAARVSTDSSVPPQPMWEISIGPRVMGRTFTYTDNLAALPGYTLSAAPALAGDGAIYPTAGSTSPARNFGFAAHFESSVAVKTVGRNGAASADTSLRAYFVGGRYRVPINNFLFTFGADYGEHKFDIAITDGAPPNVKYSILRPSAMVRAEAGGGLSLNLTLGYLNVLSVGEMGRDDRFPRDTVTGAEVGAGIGYTVDENFEVHLAADLRHYAHSMNVRPGDKYLVGGALDEHFGVALLVSYHAR